MTKERKFIFKISEARQIEWKECRSYWKFESSIKNKYIKSPFGSVDDKNFQVKTFMLRLLKLVL